MTKMRTLIPQLQSFTRQKHVKKKKQEEKEEEKDNGAPFDSLQRKCDRRQTELTTEEQETLNLSRPKKEQQSERDLLERYKNENKSHTRGTHRRNTRCSSYTTKKKKHQERETYV